MLFPIAMDAPCKTVAIWTKNEKIYEFDVPIGESGSPYRFQYYAPLNIESWRGQEIFIEVEDAWDFLEAIGFRMIMCIQNSISRRFIFPRKPDG